MDNLEQTDVVSNIKRTLTCQICQNLFVDPRILPCLHTFCCQCVESLVRNRPLKDKTLKCPTCQLETELDSRASARTLPANSLLVSMLDFLRIQEGKTIGCDICDDSEESLANVRCRECSLYLCGLHEEAHRRARDTKLHVLLNLGELPLFHPISSFRDRQLLSLSFYDLLVTVSKSRSVTGWSFGMSVSQSGSQSVSHFQSLFQSLNKLVRQSITELGRQFVH